MGWNGSGVFTRIYNWVSDAASSIDIDPARMDGEFNNFKAGLDNTLPRDGQAAMTGNLPMSGFKITGAGAATSPGDVMTQAASDARYSKGSVTAPSSSWVTIGDGARPNPVYNPSAPGGILTGAGTVTIGQGAGVTADDATISVLIGNRVAELASGIYASEIIGFRSGGKITDGVYFSGIGTDTFPNATQVENTASLGAKTGLYKLVSLGSVVVGAGAGEGGGSLNNTVIIGASAADAFQPASLAAATADPHDMDANTIVGAYAARGLKGDFNSLFGANIASLLTNITGTFTAGFGRGALPAWTTGTGISAFGDGSGAVISTGSFSSFFGFAARASSSAITNSTALGANAIVDENDLCQIGDSALVKVRTHAHFIPRSNGARDLGESATRWRNAFVQQVSFPATQVASADANTLDDYEEGSFTPVITPVSGTVTTYSSSGTYTKIGNRVFFDCNVTVTNNGTGGGALDVDLPAFSPAAASAVAGQNANTGVAIAGNIGVGSTTVRIFSAAAAYPVATGQTLRFSGHYRV